jgi:hypothetical protein
MRKTLARLGWLVALAVVSGCGAGPTPSIDGSVIVKVTLSRSGGAGPEIDHAPLPNIDVTVSDTTGHEWRDETGENGSATLSIPPGDYTVDISYCPDAPKAVTVSTGQASRVRFDCVAP